MPSRAIDPLRSFAAPGEPYPLGESFHGGPVSQQRHGARGRPVEKRTSIARNRRRQARILRLLPWAVAVVAAVLFVSVTDGGRVVRPAAPLMAQLDHVLARAGLGIGEVIITGHRRTTEAEISDRLSLRGRHSLWLLDLTEMKRRVEALPWVAEATISRSLPDRLLVSVRERVPVAVWSDGRRPGVFIDEDGKALGASGTAVAGGLPVYFGKGGRAHAAAMRAAMLGLDELAKQVRVFEWTAERRWTLHLVSGQVIQLPETGWHLALAGLMRGQPGQRLLDADFSILDLRVSGETVLRGRASGRGGPHG